MAKNTGSGSRVGRAKGRSQVQNPKSGLWTKGDTATGKFTQMKKSGGTFKSVRRER